MVQAGTVILLERDAEIASIRAALDAARSGEGRVVLIEGEPGIGKSTLLDAARDLAHERSMIVLEGRGGELEREYSNGVILDLFSPLLRTVKARERSLVGLAAGARPLFSLDAGSQPGDPLALMHGLYWLTVESADESPLLIAVDDVHWADEASARYLAYLARRVRDLPVAVVLTMRPPTEGEPAAVAGLRAAPDAERIRPPRLSRAAVAALFSAAGTPADDATVDAWWTATRGNPLYVIEVAQRPDIAAAGPVEVETAETLSRSIRQRLRLLSEDARRMAEAAAILGAEATLERTSTLAGVGASEAVEAVRQLTDEAVLERRSPLTFVHPIVRSAVVSAIPPAARDALHRAAARLLADTGSAVEAAVHLLECEPRGDPWAVGVLRDGAARARGQGDGTVAVRFLDRALREPPSDRVTVLRELGDAEVSVGLPGAPDHFREAIEAETDARRRAELHLGLGHALIRATDWAGARDVFRTGMTLLADGDSRLAASLEAGFVSAAWVSQTNVDEAEAIMDRFSRSGDLTLEQRELIVSRAFVQASAALGSADELAALALRAIDGVDVDTLVRFRQTVELTTGVLFTTDALEADVELLTRAIDAVPRTGMVSKLGVYSYCRAWPRYVMGELSAAAADVQAAIRAHELGWETFFPVAAGVLTFIELDRGDIAAAEAAIALLEDGSWDHRTDYAVFAPLARGRILLTRGDARAATQQFFASAEAAATVGMRSPGPAEWRSWAAAALVRSGDRVRARAIAEEGLEIARAWGARWPLAIALRGLGMAAGGAEGIDLLRESVDVARLSPGRLEEARSLVELGAALRRRGSLVEARGMLAEGVDLAHRLGAGAIREQGRAEIVAAGGRPRRYALTGRDALTPAELRVVELAASGRSNRQVAEALFVTPKAIEYHLANAYRKLGIGSRGELSGVLEERGAAATASV